MPAYVGILNDREILDVIAYLRTLRRLPVNGADRFRYDADFMTLRRIGLMPDFPNGEKRQLRGGRGELAAVLDARRAETETRLAAVQAQLERARAWAKLNFLLPHEVQP